MYTKLKKIFFIFLGVSFTGVISIFFTSNARQEGVSLLDLDLFPTVHADSPHTGDGDGFSGTGSCATGDSSTTGGGSPSGCSACNSSSSIGGTP